MTHHYVDLNHDVSQSVVVLGYFRLIPGAFVDTGELCGIGTPHVETRYTTQHTYIMIHVLLHAPPSTAIGSSFSLALQYIRVDKTTSSARRSWHSEEVSIKIKL